jgi:hypothetical protein
MTDLPQSIKIGYITLDGHEAKAYVDKQADGTWTGENKYTDEPVTVRWSEERDRWEEV